MAERFKSCSIRGCNGNAHIDGRGKRGWCHAHYLRWWRHGDPLGGRQPNPDTTVDRLKQCSVEGCEGNAHSDAGGARGYCLAHYKRWRKYGDPSGRAQRRSEKLMALEALLQSHRHDDDACIIWPYTRTKAGYGQIWSEGGTQYAHRIVCESVHGPAPTCKHQAAHSCGNGHLGCVNPRHLSWKTHAENMADKLIHGTENRGDRNGQSRLTEDQVREIRRLKGSMFQREIAEKFGVTLSTVNHIYNRTTWAWLND
jgi:hypothetical protein